MSYNESNSINTPKYSADNDKRVVFIDEDSERDDMIPSESLSRLERIRRSRMLKIAAYSGKIVLATTIGYAGFHTVAGFVGHGLGSEVSGVVSIVTGKKSESEHFNLVDAWHDLEKHAPERLEKGVGK